MQGLNILIKKKIDYLLSVNIVSSILSVVWIDFEFASNPFCVVIIFTNSSAKSTLDCSSEFPWIVPLGPVFASPINGSPLLEVFP